VRARVAEQSLLLGTILQIAVTLDIVLQTTQDTPTQIAELCQLVEEKNLEPHHPVAAFFRGWLLVSEGKVEDGLKQMRCAIDAQPRGGTRVGIVGLLALLAQTGLETGHPQTGLDAVNEAFSWIQMGMGHMFESALHRLRGALLLQTCDAMPCDDPARSHLLAQAETSFRTAIEVAGAQSARWWELRAEMCLAGLWQRQGRTVEARRLLGEIYAWFTEGFELPDLRDARALLAQLDGQLALTR
jgi:predicted ATPase